MRRKGFTLIELLAVIVILAVIALISVPLILSLVNKSRLKAAEESALFYVDTIENMLMINNVENTDGKTYKVKGKTVVDENNEVVLNLEIKGDIPYNGVTNEIKINSGFVETANLRFNAYYVHYEMNMQTKEFKTCTSQKGFLDKCDGTGSVIPDEPKVESGATIEIAKDKTYLAEVYLDPTDISKKCTKEDALANVNEFGTPTLIKEGCMKWYAYKDDGTNYTMILDHNTSGNVAWNSTSGREMKEVKEQLEIDINTWEETIKTSARLITADEIAEITGANREDTLKWNSSKRYVHKTSVNNPNPEVEISAYYLDGSGTSYSEIDGWLKKVATTSGSSRYTWLYNYLYGCTKGYDMDENGCDVADNNAYPTISNANISKVVLGYWTSLVSDEGGSPYVASISHYGLLTFDDMRMSQIYGIRPVITVPKNMFEKEEDKSEEESKEILNEVVELGDYISYTPSMQSVILTQDDTGYVGKQYIYPSELKLWRVIQKNDDGTIDVVSEYVSNTNICFAGTLGYKYYIQTLNRISVFHADADYVKEARHTGYDSTKVKKPIADSTDSEDNGFLKDMQLLNRALGTSSAKRINGTNNVTYFFASRSSGCGIWMQAGVQEIGVGLCDTYQCSSIRPTLTLKPDLKITGGDGTNDSPYTFGI